MFRLEDIARETKGRIIQGARTANIGVICTDSRKIKKREAFLALRGERFNGHDFISSAIKKEAKALIIEERYFKKEPNIVKGLRADISCIIVADTLRALGDLAHANRNKFRIPIIAVTGSSGKTTTKEMIAKVLSARYRTLKNEGTQNNLIGVPLNLLRLNTNHQLACLEFGMSLPGEISRLTQITKPTLGVITNIGQAHLENLKSKRGVFKEKGSLLKGLKAPAAGLINYDDPYLRTLATKYRKVFSFGLKKSCDFSARTVSFDRYGVSFKLAKTKQRFAIKSFGVHNIYNALAAIAVGTIFGISQSSIAKRLKYFKFPRGRFVYSKKGRLEIIDDTYNANPLSLKYALQSFSAIKRGGRKILVLADMLELGSQAACLHRQAGRLLNDSDIDYILTIGGLAHIAASSSIKYGFKKNKVYQSQDFTDLKIKLSSLLRGGDLILVKGSHAMRMERIVIFLRNMSKE
ncbi:MAG: UDP-N-acetylmuramoyl-tripeptide--D-alanyl-D-alanine ligase [Candidatus Omnitrophica bacterium]|nr:UDP-N-acetylmuramoyl-tripeptide--D-alanyl-D-alanine ligase [Candidatus Omnitrophota bacterium]